MLDMWQSKTRCNLVSKKRANKNLYAICGDESEVNEEAMDDEEELQAWCPLEESDRLSIRTSKTLRETKQKKEHISAKETYGTDSDDIPSWSSQDMLEHVRVACQHDILRMSASHTVGEKKKEMP